MTQKFHEDYSLHKKRILHELGNGNCCPKTILRSVIKDNCNGNDKNNKPCLVLNSEKPIGNYIANTMMLPKNRLPVRQKRAVMYPGI